MPSRKVLNKLQVQIFKYHKLQDSFYEYVVSKGFNLERGRNIDNKHIQPEDYKKLINYNKQNQN